MSDPVADSKELRQLGRLFGVSDQDAGHEVIGDAVTSRVETLRNALLSIINHWDEFGPEHGLDETIDRARRALKEELT